VLVILVLASLVLSVAYTLLTKRDDDNLLDEGDAFYYGLVAANAANGNWFQEPFTLEPAADHPPLTVLVLVPASRFFDGALAQRLTMSVIGALTVGAVGLAGREIGGRRVGLAAATVALINPNLWINNALVMSEALAGLLFALLLLVSYRLMRRPSIGHAAWAGALCGLLVLTRAEAGVFLALIVLPAIVLARALPWRARLGHAAIAVGCFVVVLAPWTLWVRTQFVRPVVVSTNDGLTLAGANCDETYYSSSIGYWSLDCGEALLDPALDASQNSAELRADAASFARDHVGRVPLVVIAREGRIFGYWDPAGVVDASQGEGRPVALSWAAYAVFWLLVPLSVFGALRLRRSGIAIWPLVATLAGTVVLTALFYGIPRQRIPLDVCTCILSGAAIVAVVADRRPRERIST
jgi:4-amino-4-deoxy-L-arabinose transferase-like glycosyltransferase